MKMIMPTAFGDKEVKWVGYKKLPPRREANFLAAALLGKLIYNPPYTPEVPIYETDDGDRIEDRHRLVRFEK